MSTAPSIDLNCDLGEGGRHDAELMALITSANIACGGHAGDEATMRSTVELALRHGVAIGAHPGFADREHFGRRDLPLGPAELGALVAGQIAALAALAPLRHVKPHGALYHRAERDPLAAEAVAQAVRAAGAHLILFGLAGGRLVAAGRALGLRVAGEAFADRAYRTDGSLVPRGEPGAVLADPAQAAAQGLELARFGQARSIDGRKVPVSAQTLCLHGDGPEAAAAARELRRALEAAGVELCAP